MISTIILFIYGIEKLFLRLFPSPTTQEQQVAKTTGPVV